MKGLKNKCQDWREIQIKNAANSTLPGLQAYQKVDILTTKKKEHQTQGAKRVCAVMTVGLRDTCASVT